MYRVEYRPSSLTGSPTFYVVDEDGNDVAGIFLFREDAEEVCTCMNDEEDEDPAQGIRTIELLGA